MELYVGVTMSVIAMNERGGEKIDALQAENLYLRQLVGELLLKNQRLREVAEKDGAPAESKTASA